MLSRLSGLANTVLHELSGDGEDAGSEASPAEAPTQQRHPGLEDAGRPTVHQLFCQETNRTEPAEPEMEASQPNGEEAAEDVLERLAHMERLVVQLKDLVREKDAQLQQKDAQLQDERQAAEAKLLKLKAQAKAKLASLNKRLEEQTGRGPASPAGGLRRETVAPSQVESEQKPQGTPWEETEVLRRQLREQEEAMGKLQQRLEAATGSLHEAQAQLAALQEETQEKESRLEEQARQHQAELQSLMAPSAREVEMQQKLRALQQKLEEQEAALLGRTQVVELLQQELNALEEEKKALVEKCQKAEAEADSLRNALTSERREWQSRAEELELALAEQKRAFHRLQEEAQQLSVELAEAGAARADLEQKSWAAEQRHVEEMAQKVQEMAELQRVEQDLRSCYEALQDENAQLRRQDLRRPPDISTEDASLQQGGLPEQPRGPGQSQAAPDAQETGQVIPLESQPVSEQSTVASPARDGEQPDGDQECKAASEAPEAETGTLSREPALLKDSPGFTEGAAESTQVSGAETVTEEHPQPPLRGPSAFRDSSPELRGQPLDDAGSLESHRSQRREELPSSAEAQPVPLGIPQEPSRASESSPADFLEYLSEKKHQDLSVLLLELQEAQEDVAFLKGQLPLSSHPEAEGAQPPLPGGPLQDRGGTEGGGGGGGRREEEGLALTQGSSSSRSLVTVGIQTGASLLMGTPSQPDGSCADGHKGAPEPPSISALQTEVAELRSRQTEAEELHQGVPEGTGDQVRRPQHLPEDSNGTLHTLSNEQGRLLSQPEEHRALVELREQLAQLESDLADSEKQRLSDYQAGLSQLALLKEEIQSLNNEAGSKEVKISALQKDLDEAQHLLAEQELLVKSLVSQFQEAKQEREVLVGQLQEASARDEELSRSRTAAEQEAARLEQLLSESSGQIERLRQEAAEQEEQMAEVSHSMSSRLVQLNEEKLLLGKELQSLTERLSLLLQARPTCDQGVGTEGGAEPPTERAASAKREAEELRKEHEQVKKKLQAALVSRKELLGRVRRLERELEGRREEPAAPGAKGLEVQGEEKEEEDDGNREGDATGSARDAGGESQPAGHGQDTRLGQPLSAKEAELQAALGEKDSAMVSLQAALADLQQSLLEKDARIGALQADLEAWRSAPERQPSVGQSAGSSDTAGPLVQEQSSSVVRVPEEEEEEVPPRAAPEERISALEQEKAQLQKKLQEALAVRQETAKKAQEKDRHHQEQLKQQQEAEEYGSLQEDLQALSKTLETPPLPKPDEEVPPAGEILQGPGQEGSPEGAPAGGHLLAPEALPTEQLQADLEALRDAKRELETQLSSLERELASKSATIQKLQEESRELLAELERAKGACSQAEASAASLRLELDQSRAEVAWLENLRLQQAQEEEEEKEKVLQAHKEDLESLKSQLAEKCESVRHLQAQLQEREEALQALQGQLEAQARERPRVEAAEAQQKSAEEAWRAQLQRKLQAALLSRKEALKESQALKEELAGIKAALESTSARLLEAESRASQLAKEKGALLEQLAASGEQREKLVAEVDRALVENQEASSACESLKLALEGVTREKARWEEEAGARQRAHAQELSEWQRKHQELQKEYETLLQSYENVGGEAERTQRVVEHVRQEKQQLLLRLQEAEAEKRKAEARWQEAEQDMEGMREKMRKFAKSKQQKILELEEENERLRAEGPPAGQEGSGGREEAIAHLREELESSRRNCQALAGRLEALTAEKEALDRQNQELRRSSQTQAEGTGESSCPEESSAAREVVGSTRTGPLEAAADETPPGAASEPPEPAAEGQEDGGPSHDEINRYIQQVAQLSSQVAELEERRRVAEEELSQVQRDLEATGAEKRSLEEQLAARGQEVAALQEKVLVMEQASRQAEEQLAGARRLHEALAAEKDDLEERLMNQLAELNGSIGNYQQDVADLQSQNRQLRSQVENLGESVSYLEDQKRHLLREKGEAEAEKKEHQERLRSGWKGSQAKELQELLKEKQQEVRQLQKECIRSQEKTSRLERTLKALEYVQSESQKELEAARRRVAKAGEDTARAQAELASCKVLLDDTQGEAARVLAESLKAKEELRASRAQAEAQLRQKEEDLRKHLEQERSHHRQALSGLEEKLEASRKEQARSEEEAQGLRESLRQKGLEAKQLQGSLNHTLAQLAAFTKSMSSLQDDRDRVIDESRQWERKFSQALEEKERQVQAREEACTALEEQLKASAAQVEDLQSLLASLEQDKSARESRAHQERQHHQEEVRMLQETKGDLLSRLEETQQLLSQSQDQVRKQEAELGKWKEQLSRLQESFTQCKEGQEEAENRVKSQEAQLQECRFRCEQLEADLQASKALTDQLHQEASTKDQKMMQLLAAQEEALAAAASELQQKHQEELKSLEDRMGREEAEKVALEAEKKDTLEKVDRLAEKLRSAREESKQLKAQLDSFTKSMSSLQDDRDRVLEDYRQLEQRHLAAILEKDQLIQEAAAENNTLKEELRGLHSRLDDLHAENAKLEAELVRYRQDLNQVISIKDCQQKQLLKTQLERIRALEKEKAAAEGQLRESERALAELQREKQQREQEAGTLRASLAQLEDKVAALSEGSPMTELQAQLQAKADEALALGGQLSLAQQRTRELEEEVASLEKTTAQRIREAEAEMEKTLKSLRHDAGLMRNETETAEERVAELAKDLLEMEQSLLAVTEENQDLKAQLQSFQKAMGSLQDSWDRSQEELRALEKRTTRDVEEQQLMVQSLSKEKDRLQEEEKRLLEEKEALASQLATLQRSTEEKGLLARLEQLGRQLQEKDAELLRLTAELEGASGQVKSFSKAMASLQGERDRLLSALEEVRKKAAKEEEELQPQSATGTFASPAEVLSLKKALSALQSDRDRLLVELKKLQHQYVQAGVDTAEMTRLKAQLQEQQQEAEGQRSLQAQLKEQTASLQSELQQLREEKAAREPPVTILKEEQPRRAVEKARRPSARLLEEDQHQRQAAVESAGSGRPWKGDAPGPGADPEDVQAQLRTTLKELHQKELRIQQLNSKLSQVFEEKNSLSLQLRGSSCSLRESQQRFTQVLARCEALEKRLQAGQAPGQGRVGLPTDAAPGAPQERSEHPRESYTPELQELQMKLSEAKEQQIRAKEDLLHLEEQLRVERDQRLAAEEAFSSAQDHIRRLESAEWAPSGDTSIEISPSPEHRLLVGPPGNSFSKARGGTGGLRRVLRSLFCARRRLPLLATIYLLAVHLLLLLCFTGHL